MDKQKVIDFCRAKIESQLKQFRQQLDSIREARDQETKSSVGDKYETGRAMMQSEEARIMNQYDLSKMLLRDLEAGIKLPSNGKVQKGSLVHVGDNWYYLSVPLGKLRLPEGKYYAISISSPMGMELLGKAKGDRFVFRGKEMQILNLL